jgi:FkbM family methyltransferase
MKSIFDFMDKLKIVSMLFIRRQLNVQTAAGYLLASDPFRSLGLYPRIITTPNGFKIYIGHIATLASNIYDQYISREYEQHPEFIPKFGWMIFDIGAYIGIYSLRASRLIGKGIVIAFEPNPISYWWFKENIKLNNVSNVKVLPIALGDKKGCLDFFAITKGNVEASTMVKDHLLSGFLYNEHLKVTKVKVPVYTLDEIIQHYVPDKHVDLVKIDVEGSELIVLMGAKESLKRKFIERLVIEVHKDIVNSWELKKMLERFGYKIVLEVDSGLLKGIIYAMSVSASK